MYHKLRQTAETIGVIRRYSIFLQHWLKQSHGLSRREFAREAKINDLQICLLDRVLVPEEEILWLQIAMPKNINRLSEI